MAKQLNKPEMSAYPTTPEQSQSIEKLLVGIWGNLLDGVMVFETRRDKNGKISDFIWVSANLAAERMLGHTHLTGKSLIEIIPQAKKSGLFQFFIDVTESNQSKDEKLPYESNSIHTWFRVLATKLNDHLAITFEDIFVRKFNIETTREERFRNLIEFSSDWYWEQDENFRFTYVSQGISDKSVSKPHDYLGKTRWEISHIRLSDEEWAIHKATLHSHQPFHNVVFIHTGSTGEIRYISASGQPIFDAAGTFKGYRGIGKDITRSKLAEDALRENEERFRNLTELSSDWYWEQDENYRFTGTSGGRKASSPLRAEEDIGKTRWELPFVGVTEAQWGAHKKILTERKPFYDLELARLLKDGTVRYICVSGHPLFDKNGIFKGYRGVGKDITESKLAEEALRKSEERFRSLIDLSSDWYWEQDENFRFTFISNGILKTAGIEPKSDLGLRSWELNIIDKIEEDWEKHKSSLHAHQEFRDFVFKRTDKRNHIHYVSLSGQPIFDNQKIFQGYRGIGKDITQHRRLQEVVYEIAAGVSAETGEPFFRLLVQHLARTLNIKYAFVGELLDTNTIQTIAVYGDNEITSNLTYHLINSPCENVVGKKLCVYSEGVQAQFPKDMLLNEMNIESYAGCPLFDAVGNPLGLLTVMDIKPFEEIEFTKTMLQIFAVRAASELERKQGEDRLRLSDLVFNNTNEGIIVTDGKGIIQSINPAFEAMSGYKPEEITGKTPRILKSGRHDQAFYTQMWDGLIKYGHWQGEIWNRRKNGEIYPGWLNITEVRNSNDELVHYAAIFSDITELKLTEERLYHLAHHDVLTNLPNRPLFHDRLHQAITQAQRNQVMVAVIFLDLDRFKSINDSLGHEAGDLLLCAFSERIRQSVRESDTIARIGGDEFTVILDDLNEIHNAATVSEKILASMRTPFRIAGHELHITTSIGISIYPVDGYDVSTLVKNADIAMYSAKKAGRNQFNFYTIDMNSASLVHLTLENQLRKALERNELVLYYQPQIEMATGQVIGAEALIRWQHPERGLLPPADFILLAEETGLIVPIGEWVVKTACEQAQIWHNEGLDSFKVAVNLSARQLGQQELLLKTVARILQNAPLAAKFFELEITESMLMENIEGTAVTLRALSDMGISIALDDFGTGYSSLNYLKRLPLNSLKIDRSFVMDIPNDMDDVKITQSILGLAHNLGLRVVAEGVETQEQLNFLKEYHCDFGQGYLFSPPVSAKDFMAVYKIYENCL